MLPSTPLQKLYPDEKCKDASFARFFIALYSPAVSKLIRKITFTDFFCRPLRSIFHVKIARIPLLACCLISSAAWAQSYNIADANTVQKRANGVLSLMAFSVVPDLASSSLSISEASGENPSLSMTQFAGGFTVGKSTYLEGGIAYSRYDPAFVASNGTSERRIPVKWNSLSLTGGVGWDFHLTDELILRPIFNFAVGRVSSDLTIGNTILQDRTGYGFDFLNNGHLDAYGLGGSLMLAYNRVREDYQVDVELRYTDITLHSFGGAESVQGTADARTTTLYSRYRAPTGWMALDRPVRYVLEFSHSQYLGSQAGVLGFDYLSTVGVGLELDSSAYDVIVTRTRLVTRYMFGPDVSGISVGLAMSF